MTNILGDPGAFFSARFVFPLPPLSAPGSPRMYVKGLGNLPLRSVKGPKSANKHIMADFLRKMSDFIKFLKKTVHGE